METEASQSIPKGSALRQISRFRWVILGLVFFATTVNYVDRMVMGILAPELQRIYHISNIQYGYIQSAFALSYAFGQLVVGGILDIVGVKLGYSLALAAWSIASILHVVARGPWGFGIMRVFLGISESPNFPAATKTISEWFPRRERAFAFGFVNAGTNMGAIIAPAVVPFLRWQWAFVGTGTIGLIWLLFWIPLYKHPDEHPKVSAAELQLIRSDPPEETRKVRWLTMFAYRQTWAFALGKFLTDSMWWFYITWFPKFLYDQYNLPLVQMGLPLVLVYVMSDLGSVSGGWLSSAMIKRGLSVNFSRKTAMLICAFGVVPMIFAQNVSSKWIAILIMGLATASHQGFSSNLYTLVSDMFPKASVASVAGLGGTFGYFGAFLFQLLVGYMVTGKNTYIVPFICAGTAYLLAFAVIQTLVPRLDPVRLKFPDADAPVQ
jgi:ACS family hexuronate transporter-like MFS transporter